MLNVRLVCRRLLPLMFAAFIFGSTIDQPLLAEDKPGSLETLASDFWQWRARYQPFSTDDIPRIERPMAGPRDWSAASIAKQKTALVDFEKQWKQIDPTGWSVARQVDYRLIGSAIARVRWELDVNLRWKRDPSFYLDQTLTALLEALLQPPPFDALRSREIVDRMENIPKIIEDGKANLRAVRPFAALAIGELQQIRPELERVEREVSPLLHDSTSANDRLATEFKSATEKAILALESYRTWLQARLDTMPENAAVGRENYEFFLHKVALLPCNPEQLLSISRQEWARSLAFEQYEKQRNQGLPELKLAGNLQEEIDRVKRDELAVRKFLEDKGILTVPSEVRHYTLRPMPGYLDALSDFGEMDDFTGPSRLNDDGVRWGSPPSLQLGYFWLAMAKDPRPEITHEGVPGHYFQMSLSWRHPDLIRRHYYDSGANEGIGFYAEEMMLQAGLFDDSPRSREIIYNFMRLRALRVEVDVKLALGSFTMAQAADYLAQHVPMDKKSAEAEAALFATTPGQAISYQIGKSQILHFLADARLAQGDKFSLRAFHDFLWTNGNVPIALQQWEYLGKDDDLQIIDNRNDNRN
ncbi:MAG: DUF885 domain-containing protein [Acidobacteriia bacterium]|nr:DUF885 domain-containing protein [Terriglobia bacterium]